MNVIDAMRAFLKCERIKKVGNDEILFCDKSIEPEKIVFHYKNGTTSHEGCDAFFSPDGKYEIFEETFDLVEAMKRMLNGCNVKRKGRRGYYFIEDDKIKFTYFDRALGSLGIFSFRWDDEFVEVNEDCITTQSKL